MKELHNAIKKWWAITGKPTEKQALAYLDEEATERDKEQDGTLQYWLEHADVLWCSMQYAMIREKGAPVINHLERPYINAVIQSNLSKVTPCWQLSRYDAQAHARSLEGERYPTVDALPLEAGDYGRFWVWKATSGTEAGKVLKGNNFKSKAECYENIK